MYLIDQHTKAIMEECKERARAAGLVFENETLEYIVTNRDLLDLSPKFMIPTLYDYWVNDVEVLQQYAKYKLYPSNPFETVINSRPAISFYNDNNPDWLNIMIFYHVLAHIDFFQNNIYFSHTWNDDFVGIALADKRLINMYRSKYGRWVDYVIEFARSIDNIVGFYSIIFNQYLEETHKDPPPKLDFFFNHFLPNVIKANELDRYKYLNHFNEIFAKHKDNAEQIFFSELSSKYPEFEAIYNNYIKNKPKTTKFPDLLAFINDESPFLNKIENQWMKDIIVIIRNTALYFAPQLRTKIMNEGWASFWHDKLFRNDDRISKHEIDYAKINAEVTSISRIGLNPYAIGMRLYQYVEELANKGKLYRQYQELDNIYQRETFDAKTGEGLKTIFDIRKYFTDYNFIKVFIDQDFVNRHQLFVVGKQYNPNEQIIDYYVKSRKADDYKQMLIDSLYHPPVIVPDIDKTNENQLYLIHKFEGKPLVQEFIPEVLIGLEYLWGGEAILETTQVIIKPSENGDYAEEQKKVRYHCKQRNLTIEEI